MTMWNTTYRIMPYRFKLGGFFNKPGNYPLNRDVNVPKADAQTFKRPDLVAASEAVSDLVLEAFTEEGGRVHLETVMAALAALTVEAALLATEPQVMPWPELNRPPRYARDADGRSVLLPQIQKEADGGWIETNRSCLMLWAQDYRDPETKVLTAHDLVIDFATHFRVRKFPGNHVLPSETNEEHGSVWPAIRSWERGEQTFPYVTVPGGSKPKIWPPNAAVRFRLNVRMIQKEHKLTDYDMVLAIAFANAQLFTHCSSFDSIANCLRLVQQIYVSHSVFIPLTREY